MALIHDRELTADRANDVATAGAAMKYDLVGIDTKHGGILLDPLNTANYIHSHLFSSDSRRCKAVLHVEYDGICFDCRVAGNWLVLLHGSANTTTGMTFNKGNITLLALQTLRHMDQHFALHRVSINSWDCLFGCGTIFYGLIIIRMVCNGIKESIRQINIPLD